MFNPFVPFHNDMIAGLREMKRVYLVTQTNVQAVDHFIDNPPTHLLVSDYDSEGLAKIHYNALQDKYRAILNLENEAHRAKLEDLLKESSGFYLWAAFIKSMKEVEARLNAKYTRNIRNYVQQKTNWRIGADKTLRPKLELIFGELYIKLKYSGQEIRFKLAELEMY